MSASPIFILAPARPMVRIATLIGRIRRATTWSKQARTFDVLPLARAAACGLGALRFGAAYVDIGDSAQPFLVIEKSKFAGASDHLRLGPRRRSAASPIWPRFWMRSDLSRRWRPKVRDRRAIGWRQSRDGISRDRGAFHLAEFAYRIGYRPLRALSRQPIKALGSNGFLSKQTAPAAAAFASSPGSARAVIMMTGTLESRAESSRLRSNPLMPGM